MSLGSQFASDLKELLLEPLPGTEAQFLMAPDPKEYYNRLSPDYKEAAVLALIYPKDYKLHIAFIQRSSGGKDDKHAGQISFPGGKLESDDTNLLACALREANEEVGIAASKIKVLGELSKVYVFVSNFMVSPYVAFSSERPNFLKDETEVEEILEVSIDHLLDIENHKSKDLKIRSYLLKDVPYYDLDGKVLWGATAMMTSELMHLIKKIY